MEETKRYILDKNNGLNVMVNLFIIRYMFSHLEKASCFEVKDSMRRKSIDFYKGVVGISRQRMIRLLHGQNFEMPSANRKRLSSMFGIPEKYFEREGKCFQLGRLEEIDWKCYFNEEYGTAYDIPDYDRIKRRHIPKVKETLEGLWKKGALERDYDTGTPVYHIFYYFKQGTTYKEESKLTKFLKALSQLSLSDWEEIEDDIDRLEHYQRILEKHNQYVRAVAEYKRLKQDN